MNEPMSNQMINRSLRAAGVGVGQRLYLPEMRYLFKLLYPDEAIKGIVAGRYHHNVEHLSGFGILVATDKRVLLIDKKPMFNWYEDLSYGVISGTILKSAGISTAIVLETRTGDIVMHTLSPRSARMFAQAIEQQLMMPVMRSKISANA